MGEDKKSLTQRRKVRRALELRDQTADIGYRFTLVMTAMRARF